MSNASAPDTKSRRSWSDLAPRVISALILVPVTVAALWLGGIWFALFIGVAFAGVYREWDTMVAVAAPGLLANILSLMVALVALVYVGFGVWAAGLVAVIAILLAVVCGRASRLWRAMGLVYFISVVLALMTLRGTSMPGLFVALLLCVSVWLTDSAAFFAGRQIGGAKLSPDISPSKTWSGALGGLAFGVVFGTVVWFLVGGTPWWMGAVLAGLLSISGQLGDLGESALKRRFKIKDSGDIIPGHGGLMDRLDSLSSAALMLLAVGFLHGGAAGIAAGILVW